MDDTLRWFIVGMTALVLAAVIIVVAILAGVRATTVTNDRQEANCASASHTEDKVLMSNVCS